MVDMHFTTYEVTVLKLILYSGLFHNQLESQPSLQLLIASCIPDKELMASHSKSTITCLYYSIIVIHYSHPL